jgi:single-stranded DNA-binding protein
MGTTILRRRNKNMKNQQIQSITGRLGKNPVLYHRDTPKGRVPVAKFSLACEVFKNGKSETVWFQVSAWDKRADLCVKNLRKGDGVQLHGFASVEQFTGKQGQVTYNHFNVMFVTFLGKAKANSGVAQPVTAQAATQPVLPGLGVNPF